MNEKIESYVGGVEAYLNFDDEAGKTAFYNNALAVVDGMDESLVTEKIDYVVETWSSAVRAQNKAMWESLRRSR